MRDKANLPHRMQESLPVIWEASAPALGVWHLWVVSRATGESHAVVKTMMRRVRSLTP